jgi:hypothetical protein
MVSDRRAVPRFGEHDRRELPRFDLGRLNYQTIANVLKDHRPWEELTPAERIAMSAGASVVVQEVRRRDVYVPPRQASLLASPATDPE